MTTDADREKLLLSLIDKLSASDKVVILTYDEGQEVREIITLFQQFKLLKSILRYFAMFVAAYLAFKADLLSFLPGGDK